MEILEYIYIYTLVLGFGMLCILLNTIFLSIFILPPIYSYITLRRKKIRGFISLAVWGIFCIFIAWQFLNPSLSEEEYNLFMEVYDERCEVVEKILNDEKYTEESSRVELPPEYQYLSEDGTVLYKNYKDKKMILFYDHIQYMMGVEGDYFGYAYVSGGEEVIDFVGASNYFKIRDNWYYVIVH